jgi:predicted metal-dependent hydrolase
MWTKRRIISVEDITVEIVRKRIKTLNLTVYPPDGRVRVSAPLWVGNKDIQKMVVSRLNWIRRKQAALAGQERQYPRDMIRGENHCVWGRHFCLNIIEWNKAPRVRLINDTVLEIRVRPGTSREKRETILLQWYRTLLRERIPGLIGKWEPVIGVSVAEWRIKRMRTRWGSCNISARRIWLNLELAKKPPSCLEYIVVHEMVHLLERHHNKRFRALMDQFFPQWQLHRAQLNQVPLEDWRY